jgi:hypothetical protein
MNDDAFDCLVALVVIGVLVFAMGYGMWWLAGG